VCTTPAPARFQERRPSMLVLSRRLKEKVYFPGIGVVVHVVTVKRGVVRLGIEAPPAVTILREEVQGLHDAGQLPGTRAGEGNRGAKVPSFQILQDASFGLELTRLRLRAGRTQDVIVLLDKIQEELARLRQQLWRDGRTRAPAEPVRPRKGIPARPGPPGTHE
jgi:carbon storage regulator CsrA